MHDENSRVIIVGAGLAGLACATVLEQAGVDYLLLEASSTVGGRLKTDEMGGFLLDRGFQVMLSSYPECRRLLDLTELNLKSYKPGALVRYKGKFQRISDPWRDPLSALGTAMSPVGSLSDKLQLASMRLSLLARSDDHLLLQEESTTLKALRDRGFSNSMIDSFFRPFFGGIFLERELKTSSRLFDYLFRMFSTGEACVPERGMQEIPKFLASRLTSNRLRFGQKVERVFGNTVVTEHGQQFKSREIVLATEAKVVSELLSGSSVPCSGRSVTCVYFAAKKAPLAEAILVLNADESGPVNNFCVPSAVSSAYAPEGQSLISATVLGIPETDKIESQVRQQMTDWFGNEVEDWQHLRTYKIDYALPAQELPTKYTERSFILRDGLYVCGDHTSTASINGALESGRLVGQLIAQKVPAGS